MNTYLLNQLSAVIATAETNRVGAERWHHLIALLGDLGYGPRITPDQISELVPNIRGLQELSAATQEVIPAPPAGSKMSRRKLTADDNQAIDDRNDEGETPEQIAKGLGLSLKSVVSYLERD